MRECIVPLLLLAMTILPSTGLAQQCQQTYGSGSTELRLATGSPGELGLVRELATEFLEGEDVRLCWIKAGSGESLKYLKNRQVDVVMVHAPAAEKKAVEEGWAIERRLIGSNEFFLVGPASDPAGVATAEGIAAAYKRIAESEALFFSRGDNSGTHKKEMAVWEKAGIKPSGDWYVVTNDFMMKTLRRADAEQGYFMTDSSTWVAAKKDLGNLKVLFSGDPFIVNTYHTLAQPAGATKAQPLAVEFIEFVTSDKGQVIIGGYGKDKHGEALYNDAAYAKQYDH